MNSEQFVNAVKIVAQKGAANGVIGAIKSPPGRKPDANLAELSEWYNRLSDLEKQKVAAVVNVVADQAVYNVLLILDGVLAIEPAGQKGKLELIYDNGLKRELLNDMDRTSLSSLFKSIH